MNAQDKRLSLVIARRNMDFVVEVIRRVEGMERNGVRGKPVGAKCLERSLIRPVVGHRRVHALYATQANISNCCGIRMIVVQLDLTVSNQLPACAEKKGWEADHRQKYRTACEQPCTSAATTPDIATPMHSDD